MRGPHLSIKENAIATLRARPFPLSGGSLCKSSNSLCKSSNSLCKSSSSLCKSSSSLCKSSNSLSKSGSSLCKSFLASKAPLPSFTDGQSASDRVKRRSMGRAGYDEVVLLTGFPSFAARRMCEELLSTDDGNAKATLIHAIVRSKFASEAAEALDALPIDQRARVNLIDGDAAAMDLGLSGEEFRSLAREVDRIHHVAQASYLGVDAKTAEHVNVAGAREILELADACTDLKCLVFHSTAHVSGDREGRVFERDLKAGQGFRNIVEETKGRAEKLMRAAMDRLPIAVLRPSIVVGDSMTGEVDPFDGPYLLILLILTSPPDFALPFPGRGDVPLNLVPIDYVVRAARAIGLSKRAVGETFHLVDPSPPSARRVFELVARAGGRPQPRGFIPANLTKALLRAPGLERFAKSPRALLHTFGTDVTYDRSNADAILAGTDIRCPSFESYVDRMVEYVQLRLREKRANDEARVHDPLG
jgi:thioester reductase-like protein